MHVLHVDGTEVPVSLATLVVAERPGSAQLDWELVANTLGGWEAGLGTNALELAVITGADDRGTPLLAQLGGTAIVARFVEGTVVWRGDGELAGFDTTWLD